MEERGIYLKLVKYRELMDQVNNPIIINDMPTESKMDRSNLANLIRTSYDGDQLSILPACDCGLHYGRHKAEVGYVCEDCNTPVVSHSERPIESTVWIRAPDGVAPLMNPVAWQMISDTFTERGLNVIKWLCYTQNGTLKQTQHQTIAKLQELGIPRGYNNFVYNFDKIIQALVDARIHRPDIRARDETLKFIDQFRDDLFTPYIPIPNKIAFITETTAMGVYVDTSMAPAMDAIQTIASVDEEIGGTSQVVRENRTAKAIMQLADFYLNYIKKAIGPKEGWFRKHVFGTRITFSARAVISSITEQHRYDEIHLPWTLAVALFRMHLINKLLKRGYSARRAENAIVLVANVYDLALPECKDISDCLDELLAESPYDGIPCLLQRN